MNEVFRRPVVGREVQSRGEAFHVADIDVERAPHFGIVVPVWNTDGRALREMHASLQRQTYGRWNLSIADDGSSNDDTRAALDEIARDPRVHVARRERNAGIVHATNVALSHAQGDWIAFVDHDDALHPDALRDVARLVGEVPELEMVYTDQDRISADGAVSDRSFKSAFSPDLLRSTNCIVHLCCYRRDLLETVGGVRQGFDGSQDYDVLLRVADALPIDRVGHVARSRYHWRAAEGSVAADPSAKPWAFEAAERALADSLARRGLRGRVERHAVLGWYHTRYDITRPLTTAVVVVGPAGALRDATESALRRTTPVHVSIVDTIDAPDVTSAFAAAAATAAELVVFVTAGVVVDVGWLDALAEHAQRADVGVVGGTVRDEHGTPTFGLVLGSGGDVIPATPAIAPDDFSWSGQVVRNLSAVPLLLAAARTESIRRVHVDARLGADAFAADVGMQLRNGGSNVVTTPHATATWVGRSKMVDAPAQATRRLRERWALDRAGDPFLNPDLPFVREKHKRGLARIRARFTSNQR